jgi:hypothetical protein
MRHTTFTLWLATLLTLFLPTLACKQRYFRYKLEYQNCNEGTAPGVEDRATTQCGSFAGFYRQYNTQTVNGALGRDIDSSISFPQESSKDVSSCITYYCTITAWRFREWQTEFDDRAAPSFEKQGWSFDKDWYNGGTVDC